MGQGKEERGMGRGDKKEGMQEMSVGGQVKKDRKAGPRRGERKFEEKNNLKV